MKRHAFDPFSFVFGLMFTGLGGLLLNSEIDFADLSGRWLFPLPLLFVGLLFAAFGYSRMRKGQEAQDSALQDTEDDTSIVE